MYNISMTSAFYNFIKKLLSMFLLILSFGSIVPFVTLTGPHPNPLVLVTIALSTTFTGRDQITSGLS